MNDTQKVAICTGSGRHGGLGEAILKLAEQCRRYETEREKVLPFYANTQLSGTATGFLRRQQPETVRWFMNVTAEALHVPK